MPILDFAFLKNRYDFELDRKEKLTAALTLPVGVLSVLGGALIAMVRTFTYTDPRLTWFFIAGLVASALTFVTCLVLLGVAYIAQTYVYLPLLRQLTNSRDEFLEYAKVMAGGAGEVMEDFEGDVVRRIIDAADANTISNDRRSRFMHWSRISLFAVLTSVAFSGVFYMFDQVRFAMPTQQAPKPAPVQPAQQSPVPQRPSVPENRVIKEGREQKIEKK